MTGKKASPKTDDVVSQIKKEMINYIGPIFEELKTDIRNFDGRMVGVEKRLTNVETKVTSLKGEIIHEVKILLENDKRIYVAMESAKTASDNAVVVKNLEKRVTNLEQDVKTIRTINKI